MRVVDTPLTEWLTRQISKDGRFKSARQLAIAAGLNQNSVTMVLERGRAEPETLIKLGKATGHSERFMFELAGWLPPEPEEVAAKQKASQVAADLERVPEDLQDWALARVRELLGELQRPEGAAVARLSLQAAGRSQSR